jgi:hypothetical protein
MTDRPRALSSRARVGAVAMALSVLAPALLWIATGNTFSAHVGSVSHSAAVLSIEGAPARHHTATARTTGLGTVPHDAESSHVLHLLGGCITVLGAVLLLAGAGTFSRARPAASASGAEGRVVPCRATGARWWPPPLSPPTTSPLLRT